MSYELIPPGDYRAVAVPVTTDDGPTFVQFGKTNSGKTFVLLNFEILDGPSAGKTISWRGFFTTEKAEKRTVESLRYCGFRGEELSAASAQELDQEVSIAIDHEEYEGKVRDRVKWVNRPGGRGYKLKEQLPGADLKKLSSSLKLKVKDIPEEPGKKAERLPPAEEADPF